MGSSVSRSTSRTSVLEVEHHAKHRGKKHDVVLPRSVISANVRLALRCKSMFSEKTRVLRARRGSPEKKSVSPRCNLGQYRRSQSASEFIQAVRVPTFSRYCNRSATASRSLSAKTGSYRPSRDRPRLSRVSDSARTEWNRVLGTRKFCRTSTA